MGSNYIFNLGGITLSGVNTLGTTTIPSAGVWIVSYTIRLSSAGANITRFLSRLNAPSAYSTIECSAGQSITANQSASNSGTAIINTTNNTTTINIQVVLGISSGTLTTDTDSYLQLTRLA